MQTEYMCRKNAGHMIMNEDTAVCTSNASNKTFGKINSKIENLKGKINVLQ